MLTCKINSVGLKYFILFSASIICDGGGGTSLAMLSRAVRHVPKPASPRDSLGVEPVLSTLGSNPDHS